MLLAVVADGWGPGVLSSAPSSSVLVRIASIRFHENNETAAGMLGTGRAADERCLDRSRHRRCRRRFVCCADSVAAPLAADRLHAALNGIRLAVTWAIRAASARSLGHQPFKVSRPKSSPKALRFTPPGTHVCVARRNQWRQVQECEGTPCPGLFSTRYRSSWLDRRHHQIMLASSPARSFRAGTRACGGGLNVGVGAPFPVCPDCRTSLFNFRRTVQ